MTIQKQRSIHSRYFLRACLFLCALFFTNGLFATEYRISGVENSEIEANIRLHLAGLDVDTSLVPARLWQAPVEQAVNQAIQPYGYYSAQMAVFDDTDFVSINLHLGKPLIIQNLTLQVIGEGRTDEWFAERFQQFPMSVGEPLLQHQYDSFKSDMLATAISRGYFDFKWQAARLDLVRERQQANVALVAQSGPRYKIGELRVSGDAIAQEIIQRINPLTVGHYYLAQDISEFNRLLNQTGYFQRAIARPLVSEAEQQHVPIEVTVVHKPRDLFDVGAGASTDIGPQLSIKWQRPWVNSRGHSISTEGFASKPEQRIASTYRIPKADVNNDYVSVKLEFERTNDRDNRSDSASLGVQRFWRPEDSDWRHSVFLRYQNETFKQGNTPSQTTNLVLPGYSISGYRARGGLDINWGNHTIVTLEGGATELLSDIDIARVSAQTKWIRTFDQHRFVARAEVGAVASSDFDRVPTSLRFFAGGDQSIRGFSYQSISPRSADNKLLGAKYLAVASLEYAYPIADNWRLATFFDTGTATNKFEEDLAWSTGLGIHYLSFIGPVRIYLARGEFEGDTSYKLHFSVGPEL